ncbi:DUF3397 domain-containing protein [Oceanobacillus longus]|uniref:DUF3397 domain-containing protein n=1 Tax=Oceanobacillus longus TaxID=930120 RepID=A0ABV8GU77_9BACI
MLNYIIYFISLFITLPIFATISIYLISVKVLHSKKLKAVHTAVNWTTILYIIVVVILFDLIFGRIFIGWIIVFFIISLSIIITYQWKTGTEVELGKAIRVIWRFSFILFLMLYILLVLVGIIQQIFV